MAVRLNERVVLHIASNRISAWKAVSCVDVYTFGSIFIKALELGCLSYKLYMSMNSCSTKDLCKTIETGTEADLWNILSSDINPNIGMYGETPLHIAARLGRFDMVCKLLMYGAKLTILDNDGFTARDRAMECGYGEIAELIEIILKKKTQSMQQTMRAVADME